MTELSPGYYAAMPQQPIDVIRGGLSPEQLTGFYRKSQRRRYGVRWTAGLERNGLGNYEN